jgi:hypothetical protein
MYPGLDEMDRGVHHRELMARGLHEQYVRSVLPPATMTLKQQLVALLGRMLVRLQNEQPGPETCVPPSLVGQRTASASSPEPIPWLIPYRMP